MRPGLVAKKLGMTRIFSAEGEHLPVTVLQVESAQVTAQRTVEKDGYAAVQIGVTPAKAKHLNKAQRGQFAAAKVEPKRKLVEFRVSDDAMLNVGDVVTADHFVAGQFVDIIGTTKGKGFAGAMKRWNFGGLEATHGVSISHRSHGSTGQRQDPGRVFKGKKMAGHLGDERVTIQNLQVVETDAAQGLIVIHGAVPGAKGSYVVIQDAVKKALPASAPYPAAVQKAAAAQVVAEAAVEQSAEENKE